MVSRIDRGLRAAGNPERAVAEKQYLKSDLEFFGASLPSVRLVIKTCLKSAPDLDRTAILTIVAALWSRRIFERRLAAVELLRTARNSLEPADLELVARLIRESKTWALSDSLATDVAAPLVERYPTLARSLDKWARHGDFWIRRSAMLALLPALRRGGGDFPRFSRYADSMLGEKEFFIRKAIGWVLREVSKKRPQLVGDWVRPRRSRLSGVTLREAVKYLPDDTVTEATPKSRAV
jgi:3-methyladenine DNA glycosylase AlkD